ncbi:hypothetical protein D3C84_546480 [compost metagenome]
MHLEGGEDMPCGDVQFASLGCFIAHACQLRLIPGNARQLRIELRLLPGDSLLVRPNANAFASQAFPGEQRTWIEFAQWCDIAMTDDAARADVVTLANVLEQDDQ